MSREREEVQRVWREAEAVSKASQELLVVWVHPESRTRIYVYPDHKRRVLYSHPGNSSPDVDEWPILWRRDTPELTEEEWTAKPWAEGWVRG